MIKRFGLLIAGGLLLATVGMAQGGQTFKGEIMDSACAASGSHAGMTKGTNTSAKDCTVACVGHGATYVLYDSTSKGVYQLSDQKKPEKFAGAKVAVTGTLDKATKTITVSDIKAAS
jgi:hypothetical protein